MAPYRSAALVPVQGSEEPRGLVRLNGARCLCTPPGIFWRLWFSVQQGDRWFCNHGGAWVFVPYTGWQEVMK